MGNSSAESLREIQACFKKFEMAEQEMFRNLLIKGTSEGNMTNLDVDDDPVMNFPSSSVSAVLAAAPTSLTTAMLQIHNTTIAEGEVNDWEDEIITDESQQQIDNYDLSDAASDADSVHTREMPRWCDLRDKVPNCDRWVDLDLPKDEQLKDFKGRIFPLIGAALDGRRDWPEPFTEKHSWIYPAIMGDELNLDLEEFKSSWTEKTTQLRQTVNWLFAENLVKEFRSVTRWEAKGYFTDEEYARFYEVTKIAIKGLKSYRGWRELCDGIINLCWKTGVASISEDPVWNITELRRHMLQTSNSREADLQLQLEALKETNRAQARVITSLTIRHILENLPGPREPGEWVSFSKRWQNFWTRTCNALRHAQKDFNRGNKQALDQHPLGFLLKQQHATNIHNIQHAGMFLYGEVSKRIHAFKGQVILEDKEESYISEVSYAIIPESARKDGGIIDLNSEYFDWNEEYEKWPQALDPPR